MKSNNSSKIFIILLYLAACTSTEGNKKSAVADFMSGIKGEPVIPLSANKIYIKLLKDNFTPDGISEKLILEIKKNINMDGRLTVVSKNEKYDLFLKGKVIAYELQPVDFGNLGRPVKKRMRIIASIQLIDIKKNSIIFYERGIQSFRIFSDIIPPIETDEHILYELIDDLAKRIFSNTITGWYTDRMTDLEKGKK